MTTSKEAAPVYISAVLVSRVDDLDQQDREALERAGKYKDWSVVIGPHPKTRLQIQDGVEILVCERCGASSGLRAAFEKILCTDGYYNARPFSKD